MTILDTFKAVSSAAVLSLAIAAPAQAAPAGDEYIPQIPTATGDQPTDQAPGLGNPGSTNAIGTADGKQAADKKKDKKDGSDKGTGTKLPTAATSASGDDDGSSGVLDTLLNPIVLLLVAGVLAIAIGMTLLRRQGSGGSDASRTRRPGSAAPPTPPGEIIGDDGPRS